MKRYRWRNSANRLGLVVAVLIAFSSPGRADFTVVDEGIWPKSWPEILEPLRKQAVTLEGPLVPSLHYGIAFSDREVFESVWPHLLKLKSEGAPIILKRGPNFFLKDNATAGVCVHTPQKGQMPQPFNGDRGLANSTYLQLVVDGDIIDLNRIPLPADTLIIDQRFFEAEDATAGVP